MFYISSDIPTSVAAWLAHDSYVPNYDILSASQLVRSLRKNILSERAHAEGKVPDRDALEMYASRGGTAVHNALEETWRDGHYKNGLDLLGHSQKEIDKYIVNPEGKVPKGRIPIYTEQSCETHIGDGLYIGGTADMVFNGQLQDYKQTKTYSFGDPNKYREYQMQGSVYRAAMPDKVKQDKALFIQMYVDWVKGQTFRKDYPPSRIVAVTVDLMPVDETLRYALKYYRAFNKLYEAEDKDIPECDDADLWRGQPVWQYFSSADNKRATGNYPTERDALFAKRQNGSKGVVRIKRDKARACHYCDAFAICQQAKRMIQSGEL